MFIQVSTRAALMIAVVCGALQLASSAALSGTPEDDRAVRDVIARWDKAWNTHDVKALVELHGDDAETVNRFGRHLKGRSEHEKQFTSIHQGPFKNAQAAPQKVFSVRFVRPDVAVVRTIWETPELSFNGRNMPREDMIVSYLMAKEGGKWVIVGVDLHNVGGGGAPVQLPRVP